MARIRRIHIACSALLLGAAPALFAFQVVSNAQKLSATGEQVSTRQLRTHLSQRRLGSKKTGVASNTIYAFTKIYDFPSPAGIDGYGAWYPPVEAPDGNLWAVSEGGGTYGYGDILKITPGGIVADVYDFTGTSDGSAPRSTLYVGNDGALYGVTTSDGKNAAGTLFRITTTGSFSVVWSFGSTGADTQPYSGVIQDSAGNFYGVTFGGFLNGTLVSGNLYEVSAEGTTFTTLKDCTTDCVEPQGGLIQGDDGQFYGTSLKGVNGFGNIYSWSDAKGFQIQYECKGNGDCYHVASTLNEIASGMFLGHSMYGGSCEGGDMFTIAAGIYTQVADYYCGGLGVYPFLGQLSIAGDGNYYGSTRYGNNVNAGNVFQYGANGVTDIYEFSGDDGAWPGGDTLEDSYGNVWGATMMGGANNSGSIYKVTGSPAIPANIQLTATPPSVSVGQPITLAYSVGHAVSTTAKQCHAFTNSAPGGLWSGSLTTSGTGSVTPTEPGTYTFAYSCGGNQTAVTIVTVNTNKPLDTTTVLTISPQNPIVSGQQATLTGAVSETSGSGVPTGTVTFYSQNVNLGSASLNSGQGSITVSSSRIPTGNYDVTAKYSGDKSNAPSSSTSVTVMLQKAPTTTLLTVTPSTVTPPGQVTLKAAVSPPLGNINATGKVIFSYEGGVIATVELNSAGIATFTTASRGVPAGSYHVAATYKGDSYNLGSTITVPVTVQ